MDDSPIYPYDEPHTPASSSQRTLPKIKLILPARKDSTPIKSSSKSSKSKKSRRASSAQSVVKGPPRPVKLKPLKEVLSKVIALIKKKDDYAFFLQPVDVAKVPGYADLVQTPMDFGTMSTKVARGKYRMLDEFLNDFCLVISNAKTFNPPGTLHHAEAARIEAYGLDQIERARPTVIEFETDWNLDIEGDGDPQELSDNETETRTRATRSPSVTGTPAPVVMGGTTSRPQRVIAQQQQQQQQAQKKEDPKMEVGLTIAAGMEEEGHLPGYRDGLSAFAHGSDMARLMWALKKKGKKYKTKKERLRIEKEGLPHLPDGSLDYWEIEDPFTVFSDLVREPPSQPQLIPLYPTPTPADATLTPEPSQSQLPIPAAVPLTAAPSSLASAEPPRKKRKHWVLTRAAPTRRRGAGADEAEPEPELEARAAHASDYGAFAGLAMEELVRGERGPADVDVEALRSQETLLEALRCSLAEGDAKGKGREDGAAAYVRDVVYGGVDGLAYARSVAEFVAGASTGGSSSLGMPLAEWVDEHVVCALTEGRHRVLQTTAEQLARGEVSESIQRAMERGEPLDIAALIRAPAELLECQQVWVGRAWRDKRKLEILEAVARRRAGEERERREKEKAQGEEEDKEKVLAFKQRTMEEARREWEAGGGREILTFTLRWVAKKIGEIAAREKETEGKVEVKTEDGADGDGDVSMADTTGEEDAVLRHVRLNLLALCQHAPVDKIGAIPQALVPPQVRNLLPADTKLTASPSL